jgi:RNA polymerase sigma-70 factor (ECF subfamily)
MTLATDGRSNYLFVTIPHILFTIDRKQLSSWSITMRCDASKNRITEFVRLLAAHEHRLGSFVLALVPNWNDAEDIIQQTKLRLWEQFETYDPDKDFGTWACVIARYEILAFRTRFARSRVQFSQELVDRMSGELVQTASESDTRLAFLEECLKKLTQWQQDLLRHYCIVGYSSQRVASELGRKAEAIRQALLRTRRKLYRCIEDAQQKEAKQP